MFKVSSSLPDIAVLRGGSKLFKQSLQEGGEVLASLKKIGYDPVDVLIEKDGAWNSGGTPTDAHTIFSKAHTIIDTTKLEKESYHHLAKKMGITIHFAQQHDISLDRETVYRLLRQHAIKVPETRIIRSNVPLKDSLFRELWTTYHTPILVRPLIRNPLTPSRIIKIFSDLEHVIREYHALGVDTHVLTYKTKAPVTSIAVLPYFRGEDVYTPLWVDVFSEEGELPGPHSPVRAHLQAPDFRKEHIKDFIKKVYKALGVNSPVCIDFINHNNTCTVVNVDLNPSLRKDGRFMQSLATTGVEAGHYIHSCIQKDISHA